MEETTMIEETTVEETTAMEETTATEETMAVEQAPDPKEIRRKGLRRQGNIQGATLLIYMAIMNVAATVVMSAAAVFQVVLDILQSDGMLNANEELFDRLLDSALTASGWGYLLSIAIGLVILLLWKKPKYIRNTIFASGRKMPIGSFLLLTVIFLTGQQLYQWWYMLLDLLARISGISLDVILESGSVDTNTVPMFLYVCFLGPIAEEVLFRGLVLRSLEPYGKKFAIFMSALLFGLFHGNVMQVPFAFVVGLVMGYVAVEYNIYWAIVLHIINNFVIADLLPRLFEFLPTGMGDNLLSIFLLACTVATVLILIVRRRDVRDYCRENATEKGTYKAFFRTPVMIIFMVIIGLTILSSPLALLLIP